MRAVLAILALALIGATAPETRVTVTLPPGIAGDAGGRLLLFVEPATAGNGSAGHVDVGDPASTGVSVAARDVSTFGTDRTITIDTGRTAFPDSFATLPAGEYRVQAVLDRDRDYAYGGRGPGDLVSRVVTIRFPLTSSPTIPLDHAVAPEPGQFDTAGIPPRAAEQIAASRPHLHDERIISKLLTRFRGKSQTVAAWVLTPPGYDPNARTTYPTVYEAGAFGTTHKLDGQQLSRIWHLMEMHAIPPMIWVCLDHATPTGTTEFADSVNNGPWGRALTREVIPALEARYRMDAKPSGRFLTGHSSGGWFALWTMVRYPKLFGGSWPSSPDPVDFHDFVGVDLYAPGANMYRDANGAARPMERDHDTIRATIEQATKLEAVRGHDGGQLRSFDWTFSPRRPDGSPAFLFDRETGAIDPVVSAYWRDHYDIGHIVETASPRLRRALDGKIHLTVGAADSYFLDGSVRRLETALRDAGVRADVTYVPGATHSMAEVYTRGTDRIALYKEMTSAMYAVARPRNGRPAE
ncbi:alpha/beta hydrolase-fold protein [Sphingomonas nostoxanthinifaciens]|uniref:alpha/beta hydrolase-fold protein n=1 Tax=Sphingomonas nostoxanthinifaciens TaxID=2872652 RepID=UPI001CC1D0FE|nr:alpha/beta hydrolase-fold protein [Sphingomonas nostoxanthinifaciens]UAK23767.1 enterochelin esterase [Sphingomonas nostoxanthinifaciens]